MNSNAIVVGTGESLLKHANGEKIDNFDCVMRSSNILEFDRKMKYAKFTGRKTDIFWFTYSKLYRASAIQSKASILCLFDDPDYYTDFYLHKSASFFNYLNINRIYLDLLYDNIFIDKKHFFAKNNYCKVSRRLKIQYTQNNIKARLRPSAGLCAIFFALENYTDVFITGFDGFTSNFYYDTKNESACPAHSGFHELLLLQSLIKKGVIKTL
jgi:hypothetical protein